MPARKPEASKAVVGMPDFKWLEDPRKAQLPTKTILKTKKKTETHHIKTISGGDGRECRHRRRREGGYGNSKEV